MLLTGCGGGSTANSSNSPSSNGNPVAQASRQVLGYAACMRSHGVPSFPDPDHDGVFTLPATIHEQAPAFLHAIDACQKVQPTSLSIDQRT
jgi:hypothetical protein